MQGVGHNVQIQDYAFVILKSIQTKISICFDPIIYPLGSHQLAGRLVCLQLHMDSWCVPSGVAKGAFKHRVSHFRNVPWHHAMYSFHLDTSPSLSVVCRKTSECLDNLWVDSQASSTLIGQVFSHLSGHVGCIQVNALFHILFASLNTLAFFQVLLHTGRPAGTTGCWGSSVFDTTGLSMEFMHSL